jgi:uracil-DNA glycosylase family 4
MAGYAEFPRSPFFVPLTCDPPDMNSAFDPTCRRCPRLAAFLDAVRLEEPGYFCRPVPPFGAPDARLLIVGLAPGKHGANRTGRPFTGDHAGILLYATLHKFGLANGGTSTAAGDGLELLDARITNAVKCLPPANKPLPLEIKVCNDFLRAELEMSRSARVILALGAIAHAAVLRASGLPSGAHRFAHAAEHSLNGDRVLLDSYHCSRYNTQTRRLTTAMFEGVVGRARDLALAARPG